MGRLTVSDHPPEHKDLSKGRSIWYLWDLSGCERRLGTEVLLDEDVENDERSDEGGAVGGHAPAQAAASARMECHDRKSANLAFKSTQLTSGPAWRLHCPWKRWPREWKDTSRCLWRKRSFREEKGGRGVSWREMEAYPDASRSKVVRESHENKTEGRAHNENMKSQ